MDESLSETAAMSGADIVELRQRSLIAKGCTMKEVINGAHPRRRFLQQAAMAAALGLCPLTSRAQQNAAETATATASSVAVATFEDVWRTVRDRFYDPHLHGLN